MHIHVSHPVFDIEQRIVEAGNQPSPVNLAPIQERIDRVAGLTPEGRSRLRIVWGQDWESTKMICFEKWVMKYPFWRIEDGEDLRDIGKPRFFIEELHTNAELNARDSWEKARFSWINGVRVDVLGPMPVDGYYTSVFMIGYHDHHCCNGREVVKNEPCMGAYREPDDSDIERIQRALQRREEASNDDIAPPAELIQKRAIDAGKNRDEKWRQGIRDVIEDFMRTHGHRFNTYDPSVLKHGKYHDMGKGNSTPQPNPAEAPFEQHIKSNSKQ